MIPPRFVMPHFLSLLPATLLALLAACESREAPQPPEKVTTVTMTPARLRDLPLTESAMGRESLLSAAEGVDPTRVQSGVALVRLPFPEHVAAHLRPGQRVELTGFSDDSRAEGSIREIRPPLNITSQSRDVIVTVRSPKGWRPLGSIRGEVSLGVRRATIVVPEQSVVMRPAGTVVYAVDGERARERPVKTGLTREGEVEITAGLRADEVVVVDGAGLLSEGARIKAREVRP